MKDKIEYSCETCKKNLKTLEEYNKHFHKNHTIRVKGLVIVDNNYVDGYIVQQNGARIKYGIALTNAKAGEEVMVRLK